MNKQKANGIEWTAVYGRTGYTWNVAGGCFHDCKWEMPDGTIAECYAKTVAESARLKPFYPQGFEHHYFHEHRLDEPLKKKEPSGIFLDSMSDLMGHWVKDEQIHQVLDVCQQASHHIFFLLTKNPRRLLNFDFPDNVWVGASSPPDFIFGKRRTPEWKRRRMSQTLHYLSKVDAKVRWVSFEPLSQDFSNSVEVHRGAIQWAVIGAASNGRVHIPPATEDFTNMMRVLDRYEIPVFFKGNLRSLLEADNDWREDFPSQEKPLVQQTMF